MTLNFHGGRHRIDHYKIQQPDFNARQQAMPQDLESFSAIDVLCLGWIGQLRTSFENV